MIELMFYGQTKTKAKKVRMRKIRAIRSRIGSLWISLTCAVILSCRSQSAHEKANALHEQDLKRVASYAGLEPTLEKHFIRRGFGTEQEIEFKWIPSEQKNKFKDSLGGEWQLTDLGLRDKDRYLISIPLKVGHTWSTVLGPNAVEHLEIVSIDERCELALVQNRNCLIVEARQRRDAKAELRARFVYAEELGLVKVQTFLLLNNGLKSIPQTEQVLVSIGKNTQKTDSFGGSGAQ